MEAILGLTLHEVLYWNEFLHCFTSHKSAIRLVFLTPWLAAGHIATVFLIFSDRLVVGTV